jgi:multidrug efflux pump subunit AcrA (membrane-fusion protein)
MTILSVKLLTASELDELRRQNEQQQALLREQAEEEMKRKQTELEAEMADVDKRIAEAKRQKEAESERKNLQAELDRLKKMLEQKQEQAKKDEAVASAPVKPKPRNEDPAPTTSAPVERLNTERPREPEKTASVPTPSPTTNSAPANNAPAPSLKPPQPGDLVLLSDEQLRRPELLQTVPKLDVPRKARDLVTKAKPAFYIMRILINDKGVVEQAMLERRSLAKTDPDYGMEDMARDAAMKTKWSIPTKQGVPVRVWSYVTITFHAR